MAANKQGVLSVRIAVLFRLRVPARIRGHGGQSARRDTKYPSASAADARGELEAGAHVGKIVLRVTQVVY
jgi:hypothetical protein